MTQKRSRYTYKVIDTMWLILFYLMSFSLLNLIVCFSFVAMSVKPTEHQELEGTSKQDGLYLQ